MPHIRAFIAIDLNHALRRELGKLQAKLDTGQRGVRWIPPDSMHLTLKFLGNVAEPDVVKISQKLAAAVGECDTFELRLAGAGCFPPHGPAKIVWAGVDEPTGRLATLAEQIERATEPLGFPREDRPYKPHITLARVNDRRAAGDVRRRLADVGPVDLGSLSVRSVVLFQSVLGRGPAQYVALSTHLLKCD